MCLCYALLPLTLPPNLLKQSSDMTWWKRDRIAVAISIAFKDGKGRLLLRHENNVMMKKKAFH